MNWAAILIIATGVYLAQRRAATRFALATSAQRQ